MLLNPIGRDLDSIENKAVGLLTDPVRAQKLKRITLPLCLVWLWNRNQIPNVAIGPAHEGRGGAISGPGAVQKISKAPVAHHRLGRALRNFRVQQVPGDNAITG